MKLQIASKKVHDVRKGSYVSILWERDAKVKKNCSAIIKKRTKAVVRVGINYENMAVTKEKRQAGIEAKGLQWGVWNDYPYFIKHTPKGSSACVDYLRAYMGNQSQVETEWFMDGRKVDKSQISDWLLASEKKNDEIQAGNPITIKVNDILSIGG